MTQGTIKVGAWYNKFDNNQKKAFSKLMGAKYADLQKIRSFLTASKKKFGTTDLQYNMNLSVTKDGKDFHWINTQKRWVEMESI
jgi:hypothetical protein